jgi:DNA-binding FrmR family transcriptional regulator
MKKLITFIFTAVLLVSCTDYDSQFDQLDAKIAELAAANESLEAEIAAMKALNDTVSKQTTATLEGFQEAVEVIIEQLTTLGSTSQDIYIKLLSIMEQISALAEQVASNSACASDIREAIAAIEDALNKLNENVLHHSGGGAHHSGGGSTAHHSGGGSLDLFPSEPTDNGDDALNLTVAVPCGTTMVRLSGPWWGWNPAGGPVGVDNGDGTFTFTFDPAPTENMEYLYTLDGVSYENLIDNAQNAECTDRVDGGRFNTDYFGYANRIWIKDSGDQAETYDSCSIDTID